VSRLVIALMAFVLVSLSAPFGLPHSSAAVKPPRRVIPLVGSDDYLVYAQFGLNSTGHLAKVGALMVMYRSGTTHKLTSISRDFSTPTLAGDMLLVPTLTTSGKFMLIDLHSGQHKTLSYRSQGRVFPVAAAPNGYLGLVTGSSPVRIVQVSWSGSKTSLGAPFNDCRDIDIQTGPQGFLALGAGDGTEESSCLANDGGVKSALFDKPGKFFTLESSGDPFACSTTRPAQVACTSTGVPCTIKLYTLKGHVQDAFTTSHQPQCPARLAAAGNRIFWFNPQPKGARLFELNGKRLTRAKGYFTYDPGPVFAFGQIIVTHSGRRHLFEVTNVHAKQRVLA
jgi:hypothetical protein